MTILQEIPVPHREAIIGGLRLPGIIVFVYQGFQSEG